MTAIAMNRARGRLSIMWMKDQQGKVIQPRSIKLLSVGDCFESLAAQQGIGGGKAAYPGKSRERLQYGDIFP